MKRKDLIANIRIAGYHNDHAKFVRLLVENRISREAADIAFKDGQYMKWGGIPCGCWICRKEKEGK